MPEPARHRASQQTHGGRAAIPAPKLRRRHVVEAAQHQCRRPLTLCIGSCHFNVTSLILIRGHDLCKDTLEPVITWP